jgi:hypothetical protein
MRRVIVQSHEFLGGSSASTPSRKPRKVLAVDAQDVVAVVEFFQSRCATATESLGDAHPEDAGQLIGGHAEQSHFAVFDLIDGVRAAQAYGLPVLLGSLGQSSQLQ